MIEQQLLRRLPDLRLGILPVPPAGDDRPALERRRPAVKHEHRLRPEEQELANPPEEPEEVRVPHHLPLLVPHRLHELDHPYTRIYTKSTTKKFQEKKRKRNQNKA